MLPLDTVINIESIPEDGRFGGRRKYDTHTGIDLYCDENTEVRAMESGVIVNICDFTGEKAGSPWWNDTKAVMIESESGVVLYGEIQPLFYWRRGDQIKEGSIIGHVKQVLKNDKGRPMTMLHLELYEIGYRGDGEWWREERPAQLKNIEELLKQKIHNYNGNQHQRHRP